MRRIVCSIHFLVCILWSLVAVRATAQPKVSSLGTASAASGTSITISGNDFNASADRNIVYFGAAKATVISASTTSLTVRIPSGATYEPVSVLDLATGLTAYSSEPFLPSFANPSGPGLTTGQYSAGGNFFEQGATGSYYDLDGDGKLDLVAWGAGGVSIYRNTSSSGSVSRSSFSNPVTFTAAYAVQFVKVSDLDGDGRPDIVFETYYSVSVIKNASTPGNLTAASWQNRIDYSVGGFLNGLIVSDVDVDGKPDLILNDYFSRAALIMRNTTASLQNPTQFSFEPGVPIGYGNSYFNSFFGLAVGDIDRDGRPDLAVISAKVLNPNVDLVVIRNNSTPGSTSAISFEAPLNIATAFFRGTPVLGDIDGDGRPEIVAELTNSIAVYQNLGLPGSLKAGSFGTPINISTPANPDLLTLGDADGDRKPDILLAGSNLSSVSAFRNSSVTGSITASSFAPKVDFQASTVVTSISLRDVDGDGFPELLAGNPNFVDLLKLTTPMMVTSASPANGPAGSTVTITGSGFDAAASNNTVYFSTVKAVVASAASNRLTVTIPAGAGYGPVSVTNTVRNQTAYAPAAFVPTFSNPLGTGIPPNFYLLKADVATGANPYAIAVGDLNNDGKPDMAAVNTTSNTVSVIQNIAQANNISAASFAAKADLATGTRPTGVAIGDVDGDGKPDMVVTNSGSNSVSVFRGTGAAGSIGTASFFTRVDFPTSLNPSSVTIGDVNSDGKADLVVTSTGSNTISVLNNTFTAGIINSASFATKIDFPADSFPRFAVLSDADGDGKPDIIVANQNSGSISVFRNTAVAGTVTPSSFAGRVNFSAGSMSNLSISAADIDGDGKPDIAVTNTLSNTVSVLRNTSTAGSINAASFAEKVDFATGANPYFVTTGDADGDGKPDLVVANQVASTVSVLRNVAVQGSITTSSFMPKADFPVSASGRPVCAAINDMDGDGIPEIMSVNAATSNISLLKINPSPNLPAITAFSPASGPVGSTVIVTGYNFDATPGNNTVYVGNVQAAVTAATPTSLTITVPGGTAYKPISVLNRSSGLASSSSRPFVTTFANPFGSGIPDNFYLPALNYNTSSYRSIIAGDLDGDGKPDLVTFVNSSLAVSRNISNTGFVYSGSFAPAVSLANDDIADIALDDVDGDGKLDIVTISGTQKMSVWKNNAIPGVLAAASFSRTDFVTGYYPAHVAISDLDGDGKPDIVTGGPVTSTLTIFRNTAQAGVINASSFAAGFDLRVGGSNLAISDLDGDGKPDLITSGGSGLSVIRNIATPGSLSTASFASPVSFITGDVYLPSIIAGDLDGDGKPELINTSYSSNMVSVLRNLSSPGIITSASFATHVEIPLGTSSANAYSVTISDLDGDGKPDLVANRPSSVTAAGVVVLRNIFSTGNLTAQSFAAPAYFNTGTGAVTTADVDGDGIPEIITSPDALLRINNLPQQPVITSFAPDRGPAGATVTITGRNFDATPANNIVYFGAVQAAVTASAFGSITVKVPAGATHQPVYVLNKINSLLGYSAKPFLATFDNPAGPGITPGFYKAKPDFSTGTIPFQVALGDLDGDGKADMVVANSSANTISILRNASVPGTTNASSFGTKLDIPVGNDPRAVVIGDVNADGKPDIVVANVSSGTVTVLCNLGFGSTSNQNVFYSRSEYATGANPFSVAVHDIDGDGKPDIIVGNLSSGTVSVLRNTYAYYNLGTPSFASRVDYPTGTYPRSLIVRDLDGDGKPDIAVANERSNTVSVLRNTSGLPGVINLSSFALMQPFATGASPSCITSSDVDGDGRPDLVVCNYSSSTISVLRNTAVPGSITPASFADKVDFPTGAQPFFVAAAEADGDGRPDLITANSSSNSLSVLRNTSVAGSITASSFDTKVDFATGGYPVAAAAGDLDNDGITELVSANAATNSVSVLSFSSQGHPSITSFTPERGPAGITATISGANFNATPSSNTVYFGAVKAAVTSGSSTTLTVTLPAGATYQPISVLDNTRGLTGYSSRPFQTTFANPFGSGIPSNFYRPGMEFALSGPYTYAVAFGDIDGDGKPDMVAVNEKAGTVSVLRNISATGSLDAGSFEGRVDISTAPAPRSVSISDIDGDGRLDILVASPASYTISVLRNASNPGNVSSYSFTRTDFSTGAYIAAFAVGDLDDDGRPDLVYTNPYSGTVSVRRNVPAPGVLGTPSFAAPVDFTTGDYPRSVVISDIDGDGKPDIIVANERSGTVSVLRNTASIGYLNAGSFAAKVDFGTGANPPAVAAGDLDGDGKPDLVVASYSSGIVSVLRNTSIAGSITASSFAPKADFATGSNPFSVAIGDADGDGRPDLLTPNATANTISVLRNTSTAGTIDTASFAGKQDFGAGGYPLNLALGDLDGDGIAEVAVANAASGAITVLKVNSTAGMAATAAAAGTYAATAEQTQVAMELYPNPTKGVFSLQLRRLKGGSANVEVLNGSGTPVEKRTVNTMGGFALVELSLRNQPAGLYYVKVTSADGVEIIKVMVQR